VPTTATAAVLGVMLGGWLVVLGVWIVAMAWAVNDTPKERR
jgi:hypothetical protein